MVICQYVLTHSTKDRLKSKYSSLYIFKENFPPPSQLYIFKKKMSSVQFFKSRNWADLSLCLVQHNLCTQMWPKKVKECGELCFPPRALDDSHSETRVAGERKGLDCFSAAEHQPLSSPGLFAFYVQRFRGEKKKKTLRGERMEQVNDPEK